MIEVSHRGLVMDFFHDRLGLHRSEDMRGILWVPEDVKHSPISMDHVAVGCAFNGFIGKVCMMHVVVQKPDLLSRDMIRKAFTYIFRDCGVNTVMGLVDSTHLDAVEFNLRLGFKEINRISAGGIDGDLIMFAMSATDCRWLKKEKRNGQEERASGP